MTDWDDPEFNEEGQQQQKPNPMREHLRKLEKENKALKEANEKALAQLRQRTVSDVLTAKGYKAKVAKLIPADVEPTDEAVGKWLEEFADVFGVTPDAGEGKAEDGAAAPAEGDKLNRISEATAAVSGVPTSQADLRTKLADPSLTREQLVELINKAGGGYGSG